MRAGCGHLTGAGPDVGAGLDLGDVTAALSDPGSLNLAERTRPPATLHQRANLVLTHLKVLVIAARSPDAVQAAKALFRQNSPVGSEESTRVPMSESGALESLACSPSPREAAAAVAANRLARVLD